jgi:hypothetical protein
MLGAPWFLLAGGILILILGACIASLKGGGSRRIFITSKMSDEEVERLLNKSQGMGAGNLLILLGLLLIFVSIVWRIVRVFV